MTRSGIAADVRRRAAALADRLRESGDIADPTWRRVFARVPRHLFVPHYARYEHAPDGVRYTLISGDDPGQREQWLDGVYSDETLITQVRGVPVEVALANGSRSGAWTSSSTAPGLMARLLESLNVADSMTVLEVGTGTGYNAALLSERLGSGNVTSVDIDEQLVDGARERLAGLGHRPTLAVADGREGLPANAPYDRVIGTCAFPNVPPAWIEQTRPGGLILANVAGGLGGAMVLVQVGEDGTASGRYLPRWAGFMPARSAKPTAEPHYPEAEVIRGTELAPAVLDDPAFAFLAQLQLGDASPYWATHEDGFQLYGLAASDGSWAEVHPADDHGRRRVEQGGPRPLWDLVEAAHQSWEDFGRPDWSSFGLTARAGAQRVWLSTRSGISWALPE
ncbi:ATP-grasp peptide maturase system methyltransferase [Actinomadura harenae]|uniref:Protein-L-isoaspartate O-methyltransferase n=1 Tax=Actinomadura harenae TaxID=2483351 RepID=A0A3M2MBG9_9ACTN|nr:ATP-grasp peptide maturase system methyltransferase [Actinomadura harenae]RMI46841.1 methyltransferase domain-containing protein [Actinomadura harenae]